MRTKKSLKVLVLALAVVMVFGVCSTALADGGFYYGTFSNGFTAGQTFNKVNDYYVEDSNLKASSSYNSHILLNGGAVKSITVNSGGYNIYGSGSTGKAGLKISRTFGASTSVKGYFCVWGGSTNKEITDWSNYWGSWDF